MSDAIRLFIALYTDEDVTSKLAVVLRERGYTAQSSAEAGMDGASDEAQLTYAARHDMTILTYNDKDFRQLAAAWAAQGRSHSGIVLSPQHSDRQFGELLRQVLRMLDTVTADEMHNVTVYLQQFA